MPFLDFIIPEYNTKPDILARALNSINRQKNIDFKEIGIIIISDGSKVKFKKSWFKQRFPKLNITYYPKEVNEGPGLTRQYGIDRSEAKYITFLDSDDELYGNDNLCQIIDSLKNENPDILWTNFIEEYIYQKKVSYYKRNPSDSHTLHGLFCNNEFLKNENIRFHEDLLFFEDSYFASLIIYGFGGKYLDIDSYLWKCNDTSLVRKDNDKINWNVKTIDDNFKFTIYVYEWLRNRNNEHSIGHIIQSINYIYLVIQSNYFDVIKDKKDMYLKKLIDLYYMVKKESFDLKSKEELDNMFLEEYEIAKISMYGLSYDLAFIDFITEYEKNNRK